MPLYNYQCDECRKAMPRLLTPEQALKDVPCKVCGKVLRRTPQPPSFQVKEVLDNGAMSKPLERFANVTELYEDHAKSGDK